jgi:hypothetical protein
MTEHDHTRLNPILDFNRSGPEALRRALKEAEAQQRETFQFRGQTYGTACTREALQSSELQKAKRALKRDTWLAALIVIGATALLAYILLRAYPLL